MSNNTTTEITLKQAFVVATSDVYDEAKWKEARKVILKAGLCPSCACDGEKAKLGRWQPGNYWENAGRECYVCEEFIVCGEQPEYGDAADEWRGDADPGL